MKRINRDYRVRNFHQVTQMLIGVIEEGTGGNAALGRPTAGKTGTTQLPETEAFKDVKGANDAWFVGYTPELVTAVWVGYDKTNPNAVMQSTGGNHPAKIFQAIMSKALQNTAISSFTMPKNYRDEGKKQSQKNDNKSGGRKKHEKKHD